MNSIDFFEAKINNTLSPMDYLQQAKLAPNNFMLVDVRNAPAHIRKEKISGSIEIAENNIINHLDNLDKNKTIVVYCWESWCNLSAKAAITLINNGYNVKELAGGIAAWNTLNLSTEQL